MGITTVAAVEELPENEPFRPSRAYATRKTVAQGMLDFALLMANASQLKAIVDVPPQHRDKFFIPMVVLLALSIALQVATGLVLLVLGMINPKEAKEQQRVENLNNASVTLILLITVINVFIAAFGINFSGSIEP